jgi:DNA-binding NarL/FixJ family response regulator
MNIKVLLADDHKVVCDGLEVLLNSESDIQVIGQARDGREAVQRVKELQPDIVIMDINMPVLDGLRATQQLMERGTSARVIILSMYAQGYLLKESAGVEVVDAVRAVHAGRRYLSQKIADDVIEEYIRLRQDTLDDHPLSPLTPREREVFQLLVDGKSRVEIADILCLSKKTVDTYRHRVMKKLDVHDIPTLVKFAIQHDLTSLK